MSFATYPSLRNRAVVVTGGASGIGQAIVEAFSANGARVAFLDIQVEAAQQLVARLDCAGAAKPIFLPCDLTDIAALQSALRTFSIINIGSIAWVIPSTNVPVYVTAKAAIVGMTRTLSHELGPANIRVNCIMPGAILTERQRRLWLTPEYEAEIIAAQALKRLILPEEVARLVLFPAADDSSAITNQTYVIDGGWV
ncbi:MAG: SDR family oxidoreductase [Acidobacteriaceae bacterium]